jgi:hypothetical protein
MQLLFQSLRQRRSQWGGLDAHWLLTVLVSPLERQHDGAGARMAKAGSWPSFGGSTIQK